MNASYDILGQQVIIKKRP